MHIDNTKGQENMSQYAYHVVTTRDKFIACLIFVQNLAW